jgi:hypothetical protein
MADAELSYQAALDEMYAGYMARRHLVAGLQDREFKDPQVILAIARELGLMPTPARTLKVTGSKGKGSTSRLLAFYLRQLCDPDQPVALFVSPEEFEHTDRMKLNGRPIGEDEFVELYQNLRPALRRAEERLDGSAYLSPFGLFLLIALAWFSRHRAVWRILEIGRGGAHDEVGVLPAEYALITSIFDEHLDHLGPTVCDVATAKAAVAASAGRTFTTRQAEGALKRCSLWEHDRFVSEEDTPHRSDVPQWLATDDRLARQAIKSVLPVDDARLLSFDIGAVSAAWGTINHRGIEVVYDALINLDSLDREWFARTFADEKTLILLSLPDDKDRDRIIAFFDSLPRAETWEVILLGKRGYLSYERAEARPDHVSGRIHYDDQAAFLSLLDEHIARYAPSKVYCLGTQTYVRLVKIALARG